MDKGIDKYKNIIINTCFSFFIITIIGFYKFDLIKNSTDKFFSYPYKPPSFSLL